MRGLAFCVRSLAAQAISPAYRWNRGNQKRSIRYSRDVSGFKHALLRHSVS